MDNVRDEQQELCPATRLFSGLCPDIRLKCSDESGNVTADCLPDIVQVDFALGMDEHVPHPGHCIPFN